MHPQPRPQSPHRSPMVHRRDDEGDVAESAVREVVLRRLAHAPRTRAELARDLARRGVPEPVSDSVLDGLEACGLIDDVQFARLWVESRHRVRGLARGALRRELTERGVSPDTVADALAHIDTESEVIRARELARRRLRTMVDCDRATQHRRLSAYLARRGYGGAVVSSVVLEVLQRDTVDHGV